MFQEAMVIVVSKDKKKKKVRKAVNDLHTFENMKFDSDKDKLIENPFGSSDSDTSDYELKRDSVKSKNLGKVGLMSIRRIN